MKILTITAAKREQFGKKTARDVRRESLISCVLNGAGETISFPIDAKEVKPLICIPNSYIAGLVIDGRTGEGGGYTVRADVSGEGRAVDFGRVCVSDESIFASRKTFLQ